MEEKKVTVVDGQGAFDSDKECFICFKEYEEKTAKICLACVTVGCGDCLANYEKRGITNC